MNDLATLTGRPRVLRAGGASYRLFPLRLVDLGRFQAWLDGRTPDPLDAIHEAAGGFAAGPWRYLTSGGTLRAERSRPLFGSPEADGLAHSVAGIAELLHLSIRRGRRFTRREASALYWDLDGSGMAKLRWAVWGLLPGPGRRDDDQDPGPFDWWGMFHRLMNDPYRLAPAQVGRLTMTQARCLLSDGKAPRADGGPVVMKTLADFNHFLKARARDPWSA